MFTLTDPLSPGPVVFRLRKTFCSLIAAASVTAITAGRPSLRSVSEVHALWVVRTTLTSADKIRELVAKSRAAGFDTLIVQVRGRGDAFYRSRWEPRAIDLEGQPAEFDPLKVTLEEGHRAGLKVHAWINTCLLANLDALPSDRSHVFAAHPEWLAVHRSVAAGLYRTDPQDPRYRQQLVDASKRDMMELEGLYMSPSHPGAAEHIYSIFMDVVDRYDVDGVHFDYVRMPNPAFDYSAAALDGFRESIQASLNDGERRLLDRSLTADPLIYPTTFPERWQQYQRDRITSLVSRVYYGVKARKPNVMVTAAVFADDENAYTRRYQDWKLWLRKGYLDGVCPMAYTPDTEIFRKQIAVARAAAAGHQVWAGIGSYRIPVESTAEKIRVAKEIGAEGFILFSYDSAVKVAENNPAGDYLDRLRTLIEVAPVKKGSTR